MGADSIRELIEALDLHEEVNQIREGLAKHTFKTKNC